MPLYEVKRYFTTCFTQEVEADTSDQAASKGCWSEYASKEVLDNLKVLKIECKIKEATQCEVC